MIVCPFFFSTGADEDFGGEISVLVPSLLGIGGKYHQPWPFDYGGGLGAVLA
jgi:hypothetical protein